MRHIIDRINDAAEELLYFATVRYFPLSFVVLCVTLVAVLIWVATGH